MNDAARAQWFRALLAARLLAINPHGLGGARLHGPPSPARDAWLAALKRWSAQAAPWRRIPAQIRDDGLLGGLDLTATLTTGRPVVRRGVLAEADGGSAILAMAERLPGFAAAKIAAALDEGHIQFARDGVQRSDPARICVVALDESGDDEAPLNARLRERLAFDLDFRGLRPEDIAFAEEPVASNIVIDGKAIEALCATAAALGIASVRAEILALRAACAHAALRGAPAVEQEDVTIAAELVLAPRATRIPEAPPEPPPQNEAEQPPPPDGESESLDADKPLADVVLDAAAACIPPDLLARLASGIAGTRGASDGSSGAEKKSGARGRPIGSVAGDPGQRDARLDLIATLRAAAPWQKLRAADGRESRVRIRIRKSDFRLRRMKPKTASTVIFAIDASGSAALHRLAEAKGAVELLLADCYVRRDRVAVLAFRGNAAELALAPTRSLVRAKRALVGLPGGGGTPMASALDAAGDLARAIRRQGGTPYLVVLSDGRANVARDGTGGRETAAAQAQESARRLRGDRIGALFIDTGARPAQAARDLADGMGAGYLALPQADAARIDRAVRANMRR
jgi:magnesium chelatase subunit D